MVLSDKDIRKYIAQKKIVVKPLEDAQIRPAAIDLTLHQNFRVFRNNSHTHIDVKKEFDVTELVKAKEDGSIIIHPREFILGSTQEVITLSPDLIGLLEGRSSLGRIGLIVHATASFVQPGFAAQLVSLVRYHLLFAHTAFRRDLEDEKTYTDFARTMSNISNLPIKIYAGMRVAQLAFLQMSSPVEIDYSKLSNKYQDQEPPTASKIWKDFE